SRSKSSSTLITYTTLFRSLRGDEMLRLEQASGVPDFAPIKTGKVDLGAGADAATTFGVAEHRSDYAYDPLTGTYSKVEDGDTMRSEEHTSELQSRGHLVCR